MTEAFDAIDAKRSAYQTECLKGAAGQDTRTPAPSVAPTSPPALKVQTEIDFHGLDNLEAYLEDATMTQETIQKWVAAGILSPQETRVAEKLIKLMRKSTPAPGKGDDRNTLQ